MSTASSVSELETLAGDVYGQINTSEYIYDYNYLDDYQYEFYAKNDSIPHFLRGHAEWEIFFRGYLTFVLAIIVVVTNTCMLLVIVRRGILSSTTVVLSALAISDVIICLSRLPGSLYFQILGNHYYYVPYHWCVADYALYILHQIFRVSSNWITALLGCQRCLSVCMLLKFKQFCTVRNTVLCVLVITIFAIILNIYEMTALEITEVQIFTNSYYNVSMTSGCHIAFSNSALTVGDKNKSLTLFYIFSGLFYRIIPVLLLAISTVILAYVLRKRSRNIQTSDMRSNRNKNSQYRRITLIIFIIMIIFLVAEIQDGVAFIIYAIEHSSNNTAQILTEDADNAWETIATFLSMIGYACNFWIFFLMSKQFRSALFEMFRKSCRKAKITRTRVHFESSEKSRHSHKGDMHSSGPPSEEETVFI